MALAKLCACTVGGAIVGGGAVHVAENPPERPAILKSSKASAPPVRHASARSKHVRRVRRTECVVRQPTTTTTTRTVTYPAAPMPIPPLPPGEMFSSSGSAPAVVVGGSGGFGGGFGGG
ncbi:MAG TPA: hypothetical protein VF727_05485, partial [Allosphingosinicella sp.]